MRARNREINIFNMSLLDILTGMLGAFLFLMIGLVPYYAKVLNSQLITPEERQKFDELKKLLDKGLKGPLSPEEAEQLKNELNRLQSANSQLQNEVAEKKQQLDQANAETQFWAQRDGTLTIVALWDSEATDIDIMVRAPDGTIFGPKKEQLFGREVRQAGIDSHSEKLKTANETLPIHLKETGSGDYLVFYRVPANAAAPVTYANLIGVLVYDQTMSKESSVQAASAGQLVPARAGGAKPGGLYAWEVITYNADTHRVSGNSPTGNLPPGIVLPP